MSAQVRHLRPVEPEGAELRAERERIAASLADAERKLSRLREAEAVERAAFDAIGALGAAEIEAVKAWAMSGCEGAQPRPDPAERQRLQDALTEAARANSAAKAAAADVEAETVPLRKRLVEIDGALRGLALEGVGQDFAARVADFAELVARMKGVLTQIRAAPEAIRTLAEAARARGEEDFGRAAYALLGRMVETRLAEPEPTFAEIAAAATDWRAKLAAAGLR